MEKWRRKALRPAVGATVVRHITDCDLAPMHDGR